MPSEPANPSPADSGNRDVRLTVLCCALAAVGALTFSALFTPDALPKFDICTFHRFTGLPCPGCGLTRAFCAISHGDFAAAWRFNPFGFLFYAGVLAVPVWAAWKWQKPGKTTLPSRWQRVVWTCVLVVFLLMCAHNVWRVVCR